MTTPVYHQYSYRGRADDGDEIGATWLAAAACDWSQTSDQTFRLRFWVGETNNKTTVNQGFKFQFDVDGAGWTDLTTTSGSCVAISSSLFADGDDATCQLYSGGSYVSDNNAMSETGTITVPTFTANQNIDTELSLQIVASDVAAGASIQFRLLESDDTTFTSYVIPSVTVLAGATTQSASHFLDTTLTKTQTNTTDLDSTLTKTQSATHTLDSSLVVVRTKTHTLDSTLTKTQTTTHITDSTLTKTQSANHKLDASLTILGTKTHELDSTLTKTQTATHLADSTLTKQANTTTHITDSTLTKTANTATYLIDTTLTKQANTTTHILDAPLGSVTTTRTKTHLFDSTLRQTNTKTHILDANLIDLRNLAIDKILLQGEFVTEAYLTGAKIIDIMLKGQSDD